MVFTAFIKIEFQFHGSANRCNHDGKCAPCHKNNVTIIGNDANGCNKIYEIGSSSLSVSVSAKIHTHTQSETKNEREREISSEESAVRTAK